ncbi:MAG: hypothetical protein ACFFAE_20655 [Candidatus Hodarchaeota archaeon]
MSDEEPKDEEDTEDEDEKKDSTAKLIYSYPLGPKFKKGTRRK